MYRQPTRGVRNDSALTQAGVETIPSSAPKRKNKKKHSTNDGDYPSSDDVDSGYISLDVLDDAEARPKKNDRSGSSRSRSNSRSRSKSRSDSRHKRSSSRSKRKHSHSHPHSHSRSNSNQFHSSTGVGNPYLQSSALPLPPKLLHTDNDAISIKSSKESKKGLSKLFGRKVRGDGYVHESSDLASAPTPGEMLESDHDHDHERERERSRGRHGSRGRRGSRSRSHSHDHNYENDHDYHYYERENREQSELQAIERAAAEARSSALFSNPYLAAPYPVPHHQYQYGVYIPSTTANMNNPAYLNNVNNYSEVAHYLPYTQNYNNYAPIMDQAMPRNVSNRSRHFSGGSFDSNKEREEFQMKNMDLINEGLHNINPISDPNLQFQQQILMTPSNFINRGRSPGVFEKIQMRSPSMTGRVISGSQQPMPNIDNQVLGIPGEFSETIMRKSSSGSTYQRRAVSSSNSIPVTQDVSQNNLGQTKAFTKVDLPALPLPNKDYNIPAAASIAMGGGKMTREEGMQYRLRAIDAQKAQLKNTPKDISLYNQLESEKQEILSYLSKDYNGEMDNVINKTKQIEEPDSRNRKSFKGLIKNMFHDKRNYNTNEIQHDYPNRITENDYQKTLGIPGQYVQPDNFNQYDSNGKLIPLGEDNKMTKSKPRKKISFTDDVDNNGDQQIDQDFLDSVRNYEEHQYLQDRLSKENEFKKKNMEMPFKDQVINQQVAFIENSKIPLDVTYNDVEDYYVDIVEIERTKNEIRKKRKEELKAYQYVYKPINGLPNEDRIAERKKKIPSLNRKLEKHLSEYSKYVNEYDIDEANKLREKAKKKEKRKEEKERVRQKLKEFAYASTSADETKQRRSSNEQPQPTHFQNNVNQTIINQYDCRSVSISSDRVSGGRNSDSGTRKSSGGSPRGATNSDFVDLTDDHRQAMNTETPDIIKQSIFNGNATGIELAIQLLSLIKVMFINSVRNYQWIVLCIVFVFALKGFLVIVSPIVPVLRFIGII
ncbi:hypothetical protein B5S30_g1375 [[Candida] boidinii]|nr:hypothetical protein B5S30_g1375 [[Candida] boidinii]